MFWFWEKDDSIDRIIKDLEIKAALDIVDNYSEWFKYFWEDRTYYKFRDWTYSYNTLYLDKGFTLLKLVSYSWDVKQIIEINWNKKIKEEFSKLFEGVKLQREWMIKLKSFMKESLEEINK